MIGSDRGPTGMSIKSAAELSREGTARVKLLRGTDIGYIWEECAVAGA